MQREEFSDGAELVEAGLMYPPWTFLRCIRNGSGAQWRSSPTPSSIFRRPRQNRE